MGAIFSVIMSRVKYSFAYNAYLIMKFYFVPNQYFWIFHSSNA